MMVFLRKLRREYERRIFLLKNKRRIKRIGKNVSVLGRVNCVGSSLYIGDFVTINEGAFLNASAELRIGNYCHISPYAQIHTGSLDIKQHYRGRKHVARPVYLEDGVWLCAGVIVTAGITIGEGSVVAAGSVVTKDVPKFELWGGVPAQKIQSLSYGT